MYLSTTDSVASSVLVKEEGTVQHPIYFTSHLLKDAETRYSNLEKLAWILVLSTRRLRPYFLSHPVIVYTNSNLGRVLTQPEVSGRLIKWTVELGEYDIQYQPRTAIKAQALADFLAKLSVPEPEETWWLYVDGSATKQGSGVGVVLISPREEIIQLSIRLSFKATNNEAEYEALLAGFQAARRVGATRLQVHSDSQLVAQQVEGNFEVKNDRLKRYAEVVAKMKTTFMEVTLHKIPRAENNKADGLAKMASSLSDWSEEGLATQVAFVAQIEQTTVVTEPADWRTPLLAFLLKGEVPSDPDQARLLRRRATRFTLVGEQLYKRAFSRPLLKCLGPEDAEYVMKEVHQGCCGNHLGGRSLARKLLLAGYFWPTLQADAAQMVATCLHCQRHQHFSHQPTELLRAATTSCLFDQWGMDIVGPFPPGPQQKKFLLVAVDYFSKWIEAEALAKITEAAVMKFLWKNLVCRYGIPHRLISDNGRQFQGKKIQAWCKGLGIQQVFTSVAYPQGNGQAEVANRKILRGLKTKLDHEGGSWVDELPCVLWAYRTTPRESTGMTPFHLVYGGEAVVPVEVGLESTRRQFYDEDNEGRRLMELDLVTEEREKAATRLTAYRQRMCRTYNRRVIPRSFQVGDFVWKKVKLVGDMSKLEPPWDGPYRVVKKTHSGAYYLIDSDGKALTRPWNATHLRPYRV
ncbi:uncharacterized protein LOC141817608 [Curcuma longa]|uniref:uncharacterized protein LOC141817608 n=1 Tax=Curcuma longa TaxID=136217 RepID=UPI003D9F4303